jgi:hypothetical protein
MFYLGVTLIHEASRVDEAGRRFDRPEDGLTLTK